jgi:thymidylate synthase
MNQPLFATGDALIRYAMRAVMDGGATSAPRGLPVKELAVSPSVLTLTDPSRPFLLSPARRPNYRFGLAEAMWILAGSDDAKLIGSFNKVMLNYSDDGERLWGAYGPRVIGQLSHVVNSLKRDRDSRQAVLMTWRPQVDTLDTASLKAAHAAGVMPTGLQPLPRFSKGSWKTKDTPCTVAWHFSIRRDLLNLNVYMRSNDIWLGLPYDLLSFTTVQRVVAAMLGVGVGVYNHIVGNLHAYKPNWAGAQDVLAETTGRLQHPILPPMTWAEGLSPELVAEMCHGVLTGTVKYDESPTGLRPYAAAVNRVRTDKTFRAAMRASR